MHYTNAVKKYNNYNFKNRIKLEEFDIQTFLTACVYLSFLIYMSLLFSIIYTMYIIYNSI